MLHDAALVIVIAVHIFDATFGSRPYDFSSVGSYNVIPNRGISTMETVKSRGQGHCCVLCATTASCVAVTYHLKQKTCTLLQLDMWTLTFNSDYVFLVQGGALTSKAKYNYITVQGALSENIKVTNGVNYTIKNFPNSMQCQYFCELVVGCCYAFQFHSITKACKIFFGAYGSGRSMVLDTRDVNWTLTYVSREAIGPYRKLPGLYPTATGFPTFMAFEVRDQLCCRKLCEQQKSTTCSLFAFSLSLAQCYVFSAAVTPSNLYMDFYASAWDTYYAITNEVPACGTAYYIKQIPGDYRTVEQHCMTTYGAKLTNIKSPDEQAFLTGIITVNTGIQNAWFWTGGTSPGFPYNFKWSCDGSSFGYSNWNYQQPDWETDLCVNLMPDGLWNNIICSAKDMVAICETCPSVTC